MNRSRGHSGGGPTTKVRGKAGNTSGDMNRSAGEGVAFVVGLMACSALFLPEHHNHEWWNYTLVENVGRHPVAALLLLGT